MVAQSGYFGKLSIFPAALAGNAMEVNFLDIYSPMAPSPSSHPWLHLLTHGSIFSPMAPSSHPWLHLLTHGSIFSPMAPSSHQWLHLLTHGSIFSPMAPSSHPWLHLLTHGSIFSPMAPFSHPRLKRLIYWSTITYGSPRGYIALSEWRNCNQIHAPKLDPKRNRYFFQVQKPHSSAGHCPRHYTSYKAKVSQ